MSRQHLARDLRVTWLVCAQQAEVGKPKEEKKSAKTTDEKPVRNRMRVRRCRLIFDVNFPNCGNASCSD